MNRVWTEEELEILRRDRAAKVPVPVTAAKLGRPVPATYARARLIGTLVQPHRVWDEASVAHLRQLVSADPPLTDKRIAEELGRTVTQVRWKLQDLGLIGVRDLSKLAKNIASNVQRTKAPPVAKKPVNCPQPGKQPRSPSKTQQKSVGAPAQATVHALTPGALDPQASFELMLKRLESTLAERLKSAIAESESGMVRAATDAIAEKRWIDQRLADLGKRIMEERSASVAEAKRMKDAANLADAAQRQHKISDAIHRARDEPTSLNRPKRTSPKPTIKKSVVPGAARPPQASASPQVLPPSAPKHVVVEKPAAPRPEAGAESAPTQMSGRGGWKSIRRDPARAMAQAKAKAKPANRADAMDLAQAAQAAIERFIAERGVTKNETNGIQTLISRLRARGYIVVQDGEGWVIDQRHSIDSETSLIAFAEARGISFDMAA